MPRLLFTLLLPFLGVVAMSAAEPRVPAAPKGETLTREHASAFAKLALKGAKQQYPNKTGHVQLNDTDTKTPKELHPAFYGCYDWHSAVHGHWMLVRVLRTHPDLPEAKEIRGVLAEHLTAEKLKAELAYFNRGEAKSFERPYGWAWLLKLAEELHTWDDPDAKAWSANLKPLADLIAGRYIEFFPKQTYPIRAGVHSNTAFGLTFAHDYAVATGNTKLREAIAERAKAYYAKDADAPAAGSRTGPTSCRRACAKLI